MHSQGKADRTTRAEEARPIDGATRVPHATLLPVAGAAVAWPLLDRGGFDPPAQVGFVALAGLALLVAATLDEKAAAEALRSPAIACLAAIAVVSLLSVAWTDVHAPDTLRWALVLGGYTAMAVSGAVATRRTGVEPIAALLAIAAGVAGLIGLWAVARHQLPQAQRLEGAWRPGGPFEYPPTLALLQVCALIPLARWAVDRRRAVALAARTGLAVATLVLALAGSQTALGLALLLLTAAVLWPREVLGRDSRREAAVLVVCTIGMGATGHAVLEIPAATGGTAQAAAVRATGLCVVVAAFMLVVQVARIPRWRPDRTSSRVLAALAAAALTALLLVKLATRDDLLHGRGETLRAAVATAGDLPFYGSGANSFAAASRPHRASLDGNVLFAHNLPVELWIELGMLGLLLGLSLYVFAAQLAVRVALRPGAALLVPCVLAFLVANLLDWSWHQPAMGSLWALALGGLAGLSSAPEPGGHVDATSAARRGGPPQR